MTTREILRQNAGQHIGYQPQSVAETTLRPGHDTPFLRRLNHMPSKISAYFHFDKIAAVWKTLYGNLEQEYYIIVATDGTCFHVEY